VNNPFDCTCGHPVNKHREKVWPRFTPRCGECDCQAYEPIYKAVKQ
jgi:hypothetical protein